MGDYFKKEEGGQERILKTRGLSERENRSERRDVIERKRPAKTCKNYEKCPDPA